MPPKNGATGLFPLKTIQILNSGCCSRTQKVVADWVRSRGLTVTVEGVTDLATIYSYGVVDLPAVRVDGTVIDASRLSDPDLLKRIEGVLAVSAG